MSFRKYNFFKKFLDFLTGFGAFLTILATLFLFVCKYFNLFEGEAFLSYIVTAVQYAFPCLVLLAGLEFFSNKNWFFLILYLLFAACLVICLYFPELAEQFVALFRKA